MQTATKRILIGTALAFIIAGSAVLTQSNGPLDWTGNYCSSNDPRTTDGCKTKVRIAVVAVALAVKALFDWYELAFPLRRLSKIQKRYVEQDLVPILTEYRKKLKTPALRANIMVPTWTIYGRIFEFLHPEGFKPPHDRDRGIVLHVWQGIAGAAFKAEGRDPVYWYFDDVWNASQGLTARSLHPPMSVYLPVLKAWWRKTPWGLTDKQAADTGHVKWILSVQMFRESEDPKKPADVRGVINLDITDAAAAQRMADSPHLIRALSDELVKVGKVCAELW